MRATLVLANGSVFHGNGFGAEAEKVGELVFNTGMSGYQEALTDPSYCGQILLFTYPLIGNYGINSFDKESEKIHPRGVIVRYLNKDHIHRNSISNLNDFLVDNSVPGLSEIDTRSIVRTIRSSGVMPAAISTKDTDPKTLLKKIEEFEYSNYDYLLDVTVPKKEVHGVGTKIALLDYGMKNGIIRELIQRKCEVHVFPASASSKDIKAIEPEGIMISNGPGDPAIPKYAHKVVEEITGYKPIFAICLGHQLLAHSHGGSTKKLKFGHRGQNHAVLDLKSNKISITTQNHGFAVDKIPRGFSVTKINVNDKTVEGMENENKDVFSVQYHPEASPGPHDSKNLFDEFLRRVR